MYTELNRDHKREYFISNKYSLITLKETTGRKELDVFVSYDLKWNRKSSDAAVNKILGQIRNSFDKTSYVS